MKKHLLILSAAALCAFPAAAADKPLAKGDVEGIVKQYITDHPEVIMDALKKYQEKEAADQTKKASQALQSHAADLLRNPHSPWAGNPNGNVTMVEFFDYHCGYCKKMVPAVAQLTKDDPKLKVVFKEFPILSEDSETAARASLAVGKLAPEKYFAYHSVLMGMSGKFEESALIAEAKKLGVDDGAMKKEMHAEWVKAELDKNRELANQLFIRGTPAFIVGDTLIPGAASADDLKKAVKDTREGKPAKKVGKTDKEDKKNADAAKADQGT